MMHPYWVKQLNTLQKNFTQAFKNNNLKLFLTKYHYPDLAPTIVDNSIGSPDGKILVIGVPSCKLKELQGISLMHLVLKGRLECYTDYESIQRYNFRNPHV